MPKALRELLFVYWFVRLKLSSMHITFIQTGGTIDKDYPRGESNHGYNFAITDPAVKYILPLSHSLFTYDIQEVTKKDSLDLTDDDRNEIREAVLASPSDKIVITHGTDTIHLTAETLESIKDKTIVLTGAMLPERFIGSDARFNVGMAVAAVQTFAPGIYVALYGRVVLWKDFLTVKQEFEDRAKNIPVHGKDIERE